MELEALREFVNPYLTNNTPIKPGLYLFLEDAEISDKLSYSYPLVSLVEIRFYRNILIADSDDWETYIPLDDVKSIIGTGRWSTKINFSS